MAKNNDANDDEVPGPSTEWNAMNVSRQNKEHLFPYDLWPFALSSHLLYIPSALLIDLRNLPSFKWK